MAVPHPEPTESLQWPSWLGLPEALAILRGLEGTPCGLDTLPRVTVHPQMCSSLVFVSRRGRGGPGMVSTALGPQHPPHRPALNDLGGACRPLGLTLACEGCACTQGPVLAGGQGGNLGCREAPWDSLLSLAGRPCVGQSGGRGTHRSRGACAHQPLQHHGAGGMAQVPWPGMLAVLGSAGLGRGQQLRPGL